MESIPHGRDGHANCLSLFLAHVGDGIEITPIFHGQTNHHFVDNIGGKHVTQILEVTEAFRRDAPDTPVILVTAKSDADRESHSPDAAGRERYFTRNAGGG